MSNRNERQRLKMQNKIHRLLGPDHHVTCSSGVFHSWLASFPNGKADFQDMYIKRKGKQWNVWAPAVSVNWVGDRIEDGIKVVKTARLLIL